ncbi:hypothetical protein BH09BAC6_BH09BAC6_20430 [soil metagenome]
MGIPVIIYNKLKKNHIAMKKLYFPSIILLLLCLSSCSVIGGIFKAGAAVGIIAVIVVILVIVWLVSMFRGKS